MGFLGSSPLSPFPSGGQLGRYKHTGIRCYLDGGRLEIGRTFEPSADLPGMVAARLGREHNIDTYLADLEKKPRITHRAMVQEVMRAE